MARTTTGIASWGVSGGTSVSTVTGVITDIDVGGEPILAPEYNEIGAVIKQTMYDEHTTVDVTVEVAAGTSKPDSGASITIAGVAGYVVRARIVENNQAYRKILVSAEAYANCTTTSAATEGGEGDEEPEGSS